MTHGRRRVDIAVRELGVSEATGRNDGVPAQRYMEGDELPWCMGLVLKVCAWAATPLPGGYWKMRNVAYAEAECLNAGIWIGPRVIPDPGDVVFFATREGSDIGSGRHAGLVESVRGHQIHTIEGNVSNRVARRVYAIGDPRITGFARPSPEVV